MLVCIYLHGQWSGDWWFVLAVFPLLNHVNNSFANCEAPICSSRYCRLVQQRLCHVLCLYENTRKRSDIRLEHCVSVAGFCLPLYNLHVLNRDINVIQMNKSSCAIDKVCFQHFVYSFKLQRWNKFVTWLEFYKQENGSYFWKKMDMSQFISENGIFLRLKYICIFFYHIAQFLI